MHARLLPCLCLLAVASLCACESKTSAPPASEGAEAKAEGAEAKAEGAEAKAEGAKAKAEEPDAKAEEAKAEETKEAKTEPAPTPVADSAWSKLVQPAPLPAKAPATSILAEAHAHAAPVAMVASDAGLKLVSLAGFERTLVEGAVDRAVYDPRTGVLLFLRDATLFAVDLYAPVAAGATPPAQALTKAASFELEGPELGISLPDHYSVVSSSDDFSASLSLLWGPKSTLSWSAGHSYDEDLEEEEESANKKEPTFELTNAAWLEQRGERLAWPAPHFKALEFPYQEDEGHVAAPGYEGRCAAWKCGESLPLGAGGYELVVTADDFGDFGHVLSLVHDRASERYIAYSAWIEGKEAWFPASELAAKRDEYQDEQAPFFEATGQVFAPYLNADRLCTLAGKCSPAGGEVIDFVAGGVQVGPAIPQR